MANNLFKPKGATSANKLGAGGAVVSPVPLFGVVKDNIDPIRSGRLRVYVSDMGGTDPDDSNSWVTVNYMTPFYGLTEGTGDKTGYGTYLQNSVSYGMWTSPPDVGTTVICIFVNGDPNYGYWIGCVPEPEALFMVPANGSTETAVLNESEANSYGGAKKLPVTNINTNNDAINESPTFYDEPKPVNSYLAGVLNQQGLIRDTIRGTIGTSAQRESPSRVGWGVNTPGRPIYEGGFTDETIAEAATSGEQQSSLKITSRRVGHSIVMDDGDLLGRDQLVRIRSSLGHQILMSDDGQCLFIIHANGQSWVELGKEGTIDMYATNSVNIRTQGDLNLHADNNINMHAKKDFNLYAENVAVNSDKKTDFRIGTDYSIQSLGKYTLKVGGGMSLASAGEASVASEAATFINGSKVNLNTGSASLVPEEVKSLPTIAHTDTLYDSTKGWAAAPGALLSVVSRAPAHSPWNSANQGVDVKVDNSASANFPSAPSPAVATTNEQVPSTPDTPVTASAAATVPVTEGISKALPTLPTTAMVSAVATQAGSGITAAAVNLGAGVVDGVAVVGKTALTPQALQNAGIIKQGAAALVDSLTSSGKTVEQALTNNLFTGVPGAETLTNLVNNSTAQVKAQVANFQIAQTQLTKAGVITGNESSGQIAGLVTATATVGLASTVDFLKTSASTVGSKVSGIVANATGSVNKLMGTAQNLISSGNFAANLSTNVTSGLSSIATSLTGITKKLGGGVSGLLDSAKGLAGSAFDAITKGFPALKAGVPQNLKQIADKAASDIQASGTALSDAANIVKSAVTTSGVDVASIASGAASSAINGAASVAAVTTAVTTATGGVTNAITALENVQSAVSSTLPASVASGLSNLPGAQNVVSTVISKGVAAVNLVPGTTDIKNAIAGVTASISTANIGNTASSLLDKLKQPGASLQALASTGLSAAAAAQLSSSISALSSGGAIQIKMPVVGLNTSNRDSISSQLTNVFGSSKIPVPNYTGNPATTGESVAETTLETFNEKRRDQRKRFNEQFEITKTAKLAWMDAVETLPAGDPTIAELKKTYETAYLKILSITDELNTLT
jgi:hypothetical protein